MGVKARVVLYAPSEEKAVSAARAGFARMDALEDVLSDYRRSSEVMRLCAAADGKPRPVSDDLAADRRPVQTEDVDVEAGLVQDLPAEVGIAPDRLQATPER